MANVTFFNRELSWIEFNARVLNQALKKDIPLLERLSFLSIVSSNFDEFFQVRVAAAKRLLVSNPETIDCSGLTPLQLLSSISDRCHDLIKKQQLCLTEEILPELKNNGFEYIRPETYSPVQKEFLQTYFRSVIFPLLTPLRTDTQAFPHIINLNLYAAFLLKPISGIKTDSEIFKGDDDAPRIAFVEIPGKISSVIWLPSENENLRQFTLLDDIVQTFGTLLFPGFSVQESLLFKVVRDADFAVDEDAGPDFINAMEDVLIKRKSSFPVQLLYSGRSDTILSFLQEKLELDEDDIYKIDGIISVSKLNEIRSADGTEKLCFEKWEHFYPSDLPEDEPYWDSLKLNDKILHVPYESYDPVVKLLNDAAKDPDVLAIKMTLYRTGRDSPIIAALERAAQNGKQVVVLVELKARFDEERNIAWATELENAGATVIYGLVNLKVHAKILMVIRREGDSVRRYVHLSTGNYNTKTARLYSDLSLFTANQEIANDATQFFNLVTGYSTLQKMNLLGMAPVTLKSNIISMIEREIERSTKDHPGLIIAKMNNLTHTEVISALYKASQAGVKILLNIRGICMLIPGVKGLSENISVISVVDRYLEHSRIFYFQNGNSPQLYLSSADWMNRNLDRRIELMFPVLEKKSFEEVKSILDSYFKDNQNAHRLTSTGEWQEITRQKNEEKFSAQEALYKKYKKRFEKSEKSHDFEFKVRRK